MMSGGSTANDQDTVSHLYHMLMHTRPRKRNHLRPRETGRLRASPEQKMPSLHSRRRP